MTDMIKIRPETARQEMLRGLMNRQATRFLALCRIRRERDLPFDQGIHDWFCDYQALIQREYAAAVNDDDSIIGKQFHYDLNVVHLPSR